MLMERQQDSVVVGVVKRGVREMGDG